MDDDDDDFEDDLPLQALDDEPDEDDLPQRRTDDVVTVLFARLRDGVEGKRLERLRRAEADLRSCIEATAGPLLTTPELALLDLERQFRPEGAVARVASAPVLLLVLPAFLEQPAWEGVDDEDRRVRMRVALALARAAARMPELGRFDIVCATMRVEQAWRAARRRLRTDQLQRAYERMSPDQRAIIDRVKERSAAHRSASGTQGESGPASA